MISQLLTSARYSQVLRLLDDERQTLLNGPLVNLEAIVEKREAALEELLKSDEKLPKAFVATLQSKAKRNSELILASMEGIKAAAARVKELTEQREELRTYNAQGAQVSVNPTITTRDKRA